MYKIADFALSKSAVGQYAVTTSPVSIVFCGDHLCSRDLSLRRKSFSRAFDPSVIDGVNLYDIDILLSCRSTHK
jgi:hypothetical protein